MVKMLRAFRDFSGGLSEVASDNMKDNELEYAKNAEPTERYGLKRATGTTIAYPVISFIPADGNGDTPIQASKIFEIIELPQRDELGIDFNMIISFVLLGDSCYLCRYDSGANIWVGIGDIVDKPLDWFIHARKLYWLDGKKFRYYDGMSIVEASLSSTGETLQEAFTNKIKTAVSVEQRGQRWFYATKDNEVVFSEIGNPLSFLPANIVNIGTNKADKITALHEFSDGLLVFQNRSIHYISGWDWVSGSDVQLRRLDVSTGTKWPKSIVTTENSVLYLGIDGVYQLRIPYYSEQIAATNISKYKIDKRLRDLEIVDCHGAVWDGTYYLALDTTKGKIEYRYYLATKAFFGEFTQGATCYAPGLSGTDYLYLGCDNGYILRYDEDSYSYVNLGNGGNVAIPMEVHTKNFDVCGAMVQDAKLKRAFIVQKQYAEESTALVMQLKADYLDKAWSWELYNDESLIWAEWPDGEGIAGTWDETYWGFSDIVTKQVPINRKAKRMQFMFRAAEFENQPILIIGIGVLYKKKKVKGSRIGISPAHAVQE